MRPESQHAGRRTSWVTLVALVLVPLIAVGALLGFTNNDRDDKVLAAIVNNDEMVEVNGQQVPMGRQLAAAIMGREDGNISWELADTRNAHDGLASGKYAAVVTIPKEFSAAATSFSANDADVARSATVGIEVSDNSPVNDSALAQEIARIAQDTLGSSLTETYLDNVYIGLNTFKEQMTTIADGAEQLADGAEQLADGTGKASDGAAQLGDGMQVLRDNAGKLMDGARALQDAGDQLRAGTRELTDRLPELVAGATQLRDNSAAIAGGADQIGEGVHQLAVGATRLSDGVDEFAARTPELVSGVHQLASGADQLLGGIPQYTDGVKQALGAIPALKSGVDQILAGLSAADPAEFGDLSQLNQLADGLALLADRIPDIQAGLEGLGADREELQAQLASLREELAALPTRANEFAAAVKRTDQTLKSWSDPSTPLPGDVARVVDQVAGQFTCPVPDDPDTCQLLEQAFRSGAEAGVRGGAGAASNVLNAPVLGGESIVSGAQGLADGATQFQAELQQFANSDLGKFLQDAEQFVDALLADPQGFDKLAQQIRSASDGLRQLADLPDMFAQLKDGLQQVSDGAGRLITESRPLVTNADSLSSGSTQLLEGIKLLDSQVGALPGGVKQLSDGASQLADGARQLDAGTRTYRDGVRAYTGGVSQLAGGVVQLGSGLAAYTDGVTQYVQGVDEFGTGVIQFADGTRSAADGVAELAEGIFQLDDGAKKLAEGTRTFATQLGDGAKEVPSYSAEQRERLSQVVASPVEKPDSLIDGARGSLVALLLVVGLWLGSIAAFVVARPVPSDVVTSRTSSATLWARSVAMPMALTALTGAALGVLGAVVLRLPLGRAAGLVVLLALVGVVFTLVNHALASWLGNIGRAIALVLLVITLAVGLSSAVPGWLGVVAGFSPVQNGLVLARTWVAEGSGMTAAIGGALLIGAIAFAFSIAAISTRRQLTPDGFRKGLVAE